MEVDILISNAFIVPMTKRGVVLRRHSIAIRDGRVVQVGPSSEVDKDVKASEVIDARGCVALPGFVNTHVHLYQNLLKGTIDDLPLVEWNNRLLVPISRAIRDYRLRRFYDPDYYVTLLAVIEMVKSGTTTFNCLDGLTPAIPKAVGDSGVRAVYSPVMVDRWLPEDLLLPLEVQVRAVKSFIRKYMNAYNGRLKFMVGPTTVFTSTEDLLRESMNIARELDVGIHMHVNETRYEVEWAQKNLGMRVIEYLDSIKMLSSRFLAVHCVWCSDEELEVIRVRGAHVSHNPES
ncbi:MAG: hypothetical protein B6U73_04785, partial [Desulfurococcales archaeon ex4484_204]